MDGIDGRMIKNVIFDVGKVLIDWNPEITMKRVGCSDEEVALLQERLFKSGIWNEEDRCVLSREELADLFVAQAPELEGKIREFYANATETASLRSYVHDWINDLKAAGYGVYVLSNFGEVAWKAAVEMGAIDFLDMTDGYMVSYMIKEIKPDPAIYNALLDKYNLSADECVFIDDAQKNIDGAKKVGISGILFTEYDEVKEKLRNIGVIY